MKCGRPWCCPGKEHVASRPNIRIVSYVNCGLARLGQPSLRPPRLHRRRRRRPREESMSRHNARPHAPPFARMLGSVVDLALAFRLGSIDRRVCAAFNSTKNCSLCGWDHSNAMQLLLLCESSEEASVLRRI